ncbi:class I SAM-dependent methyltransferase [Gracilimonas sp. Q87]|uniref:class I SAM-dependent methyltransferase n=1 Tax=Gracilimonas sp. Q87 TaxID=3384766 RepID=UPI00398427EA
MTKKKNHTKKVKEPWPTKEAMEQIYEMKLWGGSESDFYSGTGSHHPEMIDPYIEVVSSFLSSFEKPPVVCDLGCGDFNVGKALIKHTEKFVGVDIVEDLIERNKRIFKADHLEFKCLDIANDTLPCGDCALLRQVLQHLSNAEIERLMPKLYNYEYVIVTEHIPEGDFKPNIDIISGQGIRLKKQSGVDLLAPPFCLKVNQAKPLSTVPYQEGKGILVTTLYKMF